MSNNFEINIDVTNCINQFANDFQSNPYRYINEYAIQSMLSSRLRSLLEQNAKDFILISEAKRFLGINAETLKISSLVNEYPTGKSRSTGDRQDIGILSYALTKEYIEWKLSNWKKTGDKTPQINHLWAELPLALGIEIKFTPIEKGFNITSLISDVLKLKKYKTDYFKSRNEDIENAHELERFTEDFQYLALHFIQCSDMKEEKLEKSINDSTKYPNLVRAESIELNGAYVISRSGLYRLTI